MLGSHAALGRTLRPDDAEPANAAVAVISHRLWRGAMQGDPSVIGRPIHVGGHVVQVVGVAAPNFSGTMIRLGGERVDIWVPLALAGRIAPDSATILRPDALQFVGRLKPGVQRPAVLAASGAIASARAAVVASSQQGIAIVSDVSLMPAEFRTQRILIVMAIPVLVLVIACVNAAGLTLVRGSRQRRDVAIRLAIGAERSRVVRHLLLESLALACLAMLTALPLAWLALTAISARFSLPMPIDATVVAWTVLTTGVCAVASGLVPAFRVTARATAQALGVSQGNTAATPADSRGKRVLVAAQIALSIAVLVAGTQLITLVEGQGGTGGTPPDRLLMASFDLDQVRYSPEAATSFYQRLLEAAAHLPGVESVALARPTAVWTFGRGKGPGSVVVRAPQRRSEVVIGGYAGGDLFRTIGLRLIEGRTFTDIDRTALPRVAVVNQAYASGFPNREAIGRTIRVATWRRQSDQQVEAELRDVEIVGVVESAGERLYTSDGSPVGKIYVPSPLGPEPALTLYVRTRGPAEGLAQAIRTVAAAVDARVPIADMGSLAGFNERTLGPLPWLTRMCALLGVLALLLAAAGLFATASYAVTQRAREFAVRMVLGADPRGLIVHVLAQSMATVAIGFVVGCGIAMPVTRLVAAQFRGAGGIDLVAFAQSSSFLIVLMLVASVIPAIRMARLDPIAQLKDG